MWSKKCFGVLFLASLAAGCANQDPNYLRLKASDMLEIARRKDPKDHRVSTASELFEEGNRQLIASDYNLARYYFKRSIESSQDLIEDEHSELSGEEASASKVASDEKRNSAQAIARYLDGRAIVRDQEEKEKAAQERKARDMLKVRIPGKIIFGLNETFFQSASREDIQRAGQFLLANPHSILILRAQLGEGETKELVSERFEPIRSYLLGMGVGREQVRLDEDFDYGDYPQFEFYLMKPKG